MSAYWIAQSQAYSKAQTERNKHWLLKIGPTWLIIQRVGQTALRQVQDERKGVYF